MDSPHIGTSVCGEMLDVNKCMLRQVLGGLNKGISASDANK